MLPFGSKSDGKTLQLVQRGTDKRIPVELVKQPSGEGLDPAELEGLHVMVSSESGGGIATIPYSVEDGKLVVEVTADISRQLGLGVYTMTATGRIPDEAYADGYHDYEIVVALCNVTKYGSNETPVKVTANVLEGLKGEKGEKGEKGDTGERGERGLQGLQGERGLQGLQGERGLQGLQGERGERGEKGDSAYASYRATTTDSTPMTEKQWSNANDFFYQFLFLILKGAGVKPTETDMTADQVYELDRQRREIISAIKSKGVPAKESNGIGDLARLINEIYAPVIDIFKEQQLLDWVSDEFPALRVYRGYAPASLRYMLGRCSRLKRMPTLMEVDEVVDISYMCLSCTSMTSAQLPIMGKVTTAASAFNGCVLLESLEIGGLPLCKHLNSLVSGCKALKSLSLGDCSNVESIEQMATGCVSLANVTAVFVESLKSASMAFYGCSSLRKIDATIDLSTCDNVGNAFNGCTAIEEVRIKGLKVSLDLSSCANLSLESVRYLVENAQTVTSQSINLSRKLLEAHEEELSELGDTASDKGWTFNYR